MSDIKTRVLKSLEAIGVNTNDIDEGSCFGQSNLYLDSIKFLELFVELENQFDITINYMDVFNEENNRTVGELINYINVKVDSINV